MGRGKGEESKLGFSYQNTAESLDYARITPLSAVPVLLQLKAAFGVEPGNCGWGWSEGYIS